MKSKIGRFLRKWLLCSWKHSKRRCYPEVWDRGLNGPWHCMDCEPCLQSFLDKEQGRLAESGRMHRFAKAAGP